MGLVCPRCQSHGALAPESRAVVDETFVGGECPGKRGCGAATTSPIVVAAQVGEQGQLGRIRLLRLGDAGETALTLAVQAIVERGSVMPTDDWAGYQGAVRLR